MVFINNYRVVKMKNQKNNKPLKDDWVIKLIEAAKKSVDAYEKYLLDQIDYQELAKTMTELRDILPIGCKNDDEENKKD